MTVHVTIHPKFDELCYLTQEIMDDMVELGHDPDEVAGGINRFCTQIAANNSLIDYILMEQEANKE